MLFIELLLGLVLLAAFFHFQLTKRKNQYEISLITETFQYSDDMKRTLAMGLYLRFHKEKSPDDPVKFTNLFLREDPISFEHFVADIISQVKGGSTIVYPPSGDFGVDFEHNVDENLFLGQVKCYKEDVNFEPIAILHSNMVKEGAKGGYIITTSSFTPAAKQYAADLNIELINGIKLVELWIQSLNHNEQEVKKLIPQYQ